MSNTQIAEQISNGDNHQLVKKIEGHLQSRKHLKWLYRQQLAYRPPTEYE
jgi:hypothetical protein